MDRKLGGLITFAVAACIAAGAYAYFTEFAPSAEIKRMVSERLKDPESARFRDIKTAGNGLAGCGTVNSRNSMGGYAGATPFMVWDDEVIFPAADGEGALMYCCELVLEATKSNTASADIEGFNSCDGLIEPFAW